MRATVLIPIHGPPELLDLAIRSVLEQTHTDWELMLVCDGADPEAIKTAQAAADTDPRIRALVFPKGERHGEAHRHIALGEATGEAICYLCEDDFWAPEHLAEMCRLLRDHDYAHTLPLVWLGDDYRLGIASNHLGLPGGRQHLFESDTGVWGLSSGAHTLAHYRRLPQGWTAAPTGVPTDLHMWRKLLCDPLSTAAYSPLHTVFQMPASHRRLAPKPYVRAAAEEWYGLIAQPHVRDVIRRHFEHHTIGSFSVG